MTDTIRDWDDLTTWSSDDLREEVARLRSLFGASDGDGFPERGTVGVTRHCGDCGVEIGELHLPGCDVARCLFSGHQAISCDQDDHEDCGRDRWTGIWPGTLDAFRLGTDLNGLHRKRWNRDLTRWEN
jgi:hypothetical protein